MHGGRFKSAFVSSGTRALQLSVDTKHHEDTGTTGGDTSAKPVILAPKKSARAVPPPPTPVTQAPLYMRGAPVAVAPASAEAVAKVLSALVQRVYTT